MSKYDRIDRIPFFAFILLASFQTVLGIDCYRCLPKNKPVTVNQTFKSCSLFDYSSEFKIDCPLSTFCMKRNYTLDFPDGRKAVVMERGCAPQSFSYRIYKKGKWEVVNDVDEKAYENGCVLAYSEAGPPTQYCYCSSRLCNSSPLLFNDFRLLVIATILVTLNQFGIHLNVFL